MQLTDGYNPWQFQWSHWFYHPPSPTDPGWASEFVQRELDKKRTPDTHMRIFLRRSLPPRMLVQRSDKQTEMQPTSDWRSKTKRSSQPWKKKSLLYFAYRGKACSSCSFRFIVIVVCIVASIRQILDADDIHVTDDRLEQRCGDPGTVQMKFFDMIMIYRMMWIAVVIGQSTIVPTPFHGPKRKVLWWLCLH